MKDTLEYVESLAVMGLLLVGLTGLSYYMFRQGGWAESATGNLWSFTMRSPLMALATIGGAIALGYTWHQSRKFQRQNGRTATGVFYVMLASGAYFLGRLVLVGSF